MEGEIIEDLRNIDPYEFEQFVAELWERQGWQTLVRAGSGDRGVDIEAWRKDPFQRSQLIQVKRYSEDTKLTSSEVRKYATLYQQGDDVNDVVIVTTGELTSAAADLANDLSVQVLDEQTLHDLVLELDASDIVVKFANLSHDSKLDDVQSDENTDSEMTAPTHPFALHRVSDNQNPTLSQNLLLSCPECSEERVWFTKLRNGTRFLKCANCKNGYCEILPEEDRWMKYTDPDADDEYTLQELGGEYAEVEKIQKREDSEEVHPVIASLRCFIVKYWKDD